MKYKCLYIAVALLTGICSSVAQNSVKSNGGNFVDSTKSTAITIDAKQLANNTILLAYYYFGQIYVKDSITLDRKGKGRFESKERYNDGLYTICVNRAPVLDFILGADQVMSIKIDTTNHYEKVVFDGCVESGDFNKYASFMKSVQKQSREKSKLIEETKDSVEIGKIRAELKLLGASVADRQNTLIEKYPATMTGIFIKGLQSVEFKKPDGFDSMSDSMKWVVQYAFYRDHYFDNVNLADERCLHTPYLKDMLDNYLNNTLVQHYDSIIPNAIKLVEKSRKGTEATFRAVCNYMLQYCVKSNIMGMDRMIVELGKNYYMNGVATWADSALVSNIGKEVKKIEHCLVGDVAHNMVVKTLDGVDKPIYDLCGSQYTVLFFFEPQCGHCKKTAPLVSEFYEQYKDDPRINIIAVYMLTDKNEWTQFIEEKNMQNLTNVWDPDRTSFYWYWFDTSSTPMIYVLDKDHKIFAKKIDVDTLKLIATHELK